MAALYVIVFTQKKRPRVTRDRFDFRDRAGLLG